MRLTREAIEFKTTAGAWAFIVGLGVLWLIAVFVIVWASR